MACRGHGVRIRLQSHHVAHRISGDDLHDDEYDRRRGQQRGDEHARTPDQIGSAETARDQDAQHQSGRRQHSAGEAQRAGPRRGLSAVARITVGARVTVGARIRVGAGAAARSGPGAGGGAIIVCPAQIDDAQHIVEFQTLQMLVPDIEPRVLEQETVDRVVGELALNLLQ